MPPPGTAPTSDETPSTEPQSPASGPLPPPGEVPGQRPPSAPVVEAAETTLAPPVAQSLPPAPPATPTPPTPEPPAPAPVTEPPASTPEPAAPAAPPAVPGADAAPAVSAPSKRARRLITTVVFGVVVVLLLGAIGYVLYQRFLTDPTGDAVAGDCLADLPIVAVGEDREVTTARIVECSDPAATFVVEGRLDSLSETQASGAEICQAYEDATFVYRAVPRGGTGYVLCLRQLAE